MKTDNKTFIINTYSEDKYRELSSSASANQLHIVDNDNLHRTVVPSYDLLVDKVRLNLGYDPECADILLNDVDGNVISRLPAKRFISDNYLMSAAYDDGKLVLSVMLSNDEVNAISVDFPVDQSLDPLSDYAESTYPIASKAVAVALSGLSACIGTELETLKTDIAAADKTLSDAIRTEAERAKDVESKLDGKINKTSSDLIEKIEDPLIARYIEKDTRRQLILHNHDNILGELSSGTPINLVMVSEQNIADFGSIEARMNLNTLSTDNSVTINGKLSVATTDDVQNALADANSYADAKVDSSLKALSGTWKADDKHIVDQVTQTNGQVSVTYKALTVAEVSGLQDQLDSKTTREEVKDVSSALSIDYVGKISDAIADEHVVKYADGENGRKHIKLKNYDSITGYLSGENASYVNLAMVSEQNIADFGSKTIPLNLNAVDAVVTINDSLTVATTGDVGNERDRAVKSESDIIRDATLSVQKLSSELMPLIETAQQTADLKTTDVLSSEKGRSRIFNEYIGGGAKVEDARGISSFVGTNLPDAMTGTYGSMYVLSDGIGPRLKMFKEGFNYKNSGSNWYSFEESAEIATRKDVNDVSNAKLDAETFKQISTDIGLSAATPMNRVVTQNDIKGLSGAMILVGKVDKDGAPTLSTGSDVKLSDLFDVIPFGRTSADPIAGDVVIQTQQTEKESETVDKEFVWTAQNGGLWNELGSEGVYATKFELNNETQARKTADDSTLSSAKKYADSISAALRDDYDVKIAKKLDAETFKQISADIGLSAANADNQIVTNKEISGFAGTYVALSDLSAALSALSSAEIDNAEIGEIADALFSIKRLVDAKLNKS